MDAVAGLCLSTINVDKEKNNQKKKKNSTCISTFVSCIRTIRERITNTKDTTIQTGG